MNLGYHFNLIREAMLVMKEEKGADQFSPDAIELALLGNGYIDLVQPGEAEYLMDDIFCRLAKTVSDNCHFDRMCSHQFAKAYTHRLLLNTLKAAQKACNAQNPLNFMLAMGTSLHILQDFYGHTSWAELDMKRFMSEKDPTYYDLLAGDQKPLQDACTENASRDLRRFDGDHEASRQYGLFSHGTRQGIVPFPNHNKLRKDYAGQPHFEWAYRAAFKASLEHLLIVKNYLLKQPGGTAFWASLANFTLPADVASYVHTATGFNEGTIRWMSTYGGAWTWVKQWDSLDMVSDDMPGTLGIGLTEQSDWPVLGAKWLEVALDIADNLFQVDYFYSLEGLTCFSKEQFIKTANEYFSSAEGAVALFDASNLMESIKTLFDPDLLKTSDIAEAFQKGAFYKLPSTKPPELTNDEQALVASALEALNHPLIEQYQNHAHWVRVQVPYADDLDTGVGIWNVNNEECGGRSDYWPMFNVDGVIYTEAEHVDMSHPVTYWQLLKPCLSARSLKIKISLYESDPSDHTDERMNVSYGNQRDLTFTIHSETGNISEIDENVEMLACPTGIFLRTKGSGDLRAMLRVLAGKMSDRRVELSLRLLDDEGEITKNWWNVWAISGGRGWRLNRPDKFEKTLEYDHFTFDPGGQFTPDRLTSLRFAMGDMEDLLSKIFASAAAPPFSGLTNTETNAAQCQDVVYSAKYFRWGFIRNESTDLGGTFYLLTNLRAKIEPLGTVIPVGNAVDPAITAAQSEDYVNELTVVSFTGVNNVECTKAPVYISFYTDKTNDASQVGNYRLLHFDGEPFKRGCADFFWLGKQKLKLQNFNSKDGYQGQIKAIRRIAISKGAGDNLSLDRLEIYANGQMIGCVDKPIVLTKDHTLYISYPKQVRFKYPPAVSCKGIVDIPGKPGLKGIKYVIKGSLEMLGYDTPPQVVVDTKPATIAMTTDIKAMTKSALITTTIYINRKTNTHFNYEWTARVTADNETQSAKATIEIPHPYIEIIENSFTGGDQILTFGKKKALRFTGSYYFNFEHFGAADRKEMGWQSILEPAFANQPDMSKLQFLLPGDDQSQPYRNNYQLLLQVKDRSDAWQEEIRYRIDLPVLDVQILIRYRGELYRYFSGQDRISKVSPESPDYAKYAGNQESLRKDYRMVDIYLVPCLSRKGKIYSYNVFDPSYAWEVPDYAHACNLPSLVEGQPDNVQQIQSKMIRAKDMDLSLPEKSFVQHYELKGPRIAVSLADGIAEIGIPIKCTVTDAIGQRKQVTILVSTHMGLSLNEIYRIRVAKMMTAMVTRYAEHVRIKEIVSNGLRIPVMEVDTGEMQKLPSLEKQVLQEANVMAQFYEKNAASLSQNIALQQQLDRNLNSLLTKLPKVDASIKQRHSVR